MQNAFGAASIDSLLIFNGSPYLINQLEMPVSPNPGQLENKGKPFILSRNLFSLNIHILSVGIFYLRLEIFRMKSNSCRHPLHCRA